MDNFQKIIKESGYIYYYYVYQDPEGFQKARSQYMASFNAQVRTNLSKMLLFTNDEEVRKFEIPTLLVTETAIKGRVPDLFED